MEKASSSKKKMRNRLDPLAKQLDDDRVAATRPKEHDRGKGKRREERRVNKPKEFVDAKTSEKILRQAREQLDEERIESQELLRQQTGPEEDEQLLRQHMESSDSEGDELSGEEELDVYEELQIDPDDEAAVEAFMNAAAGLNKGPQNLADLVMAKIREAESGQPVAIEDLESRFNPK
jgi:hypothetical protein